MSIPDNHVVAEGRTLRAAIDSAATTLGVPVAAVDHKIDMAHFRSAGGGTTGAETVKIFAWAKDPASAAAAVAAAAARAAQPAYSERSDRPERSDRGERSGPPAYAAPAQEVVTSAASAAGEAWVKGLLDAMGRSGTVRGEMRGDAAVVFLDVGEHARHLVGRGGSTLRAIQWILEQSVGPNFNGTEFRIDVARADDGGRGADRGGDRGGRGGYRDDRGPRRDERPAFRDDRGPRRDDRGPRRDDRGPRRDDRAGAPSGGGAGFRRGGDDEELKRLARKLAEKVADSGAPEVIRRELNSYDRRLVHIEVAEVAGAKSRSIGEGHDRRVEIYREDGSSNEGGES